MNKVRGRYRIDNQREEAVLTVITETYRYRIMSF